MKNISAANRGIGTVGIIGVSVAAVFAAGCGKPAGMGGPPQGRAPEVSVWTVVPERVVLSEKLPGRVSASLVAEVRPQVSGIVRKRLFEEGTDVKAGDPLYQIDPSVYEANYAVAKATLARAEANLGAVQARADRYKDLVAVKAVSQQDYDDIAAALKQAGAEVEAGKAAVEAARINLAYTSITAPISGRIGRSAVTIGALATAYQGVPFTTIQALDPVYVDAPQSSAKLLQLKKDLASGDLKSDGEGQARVQLTLEDGTVYPHEGVLKFSDVTVDPSTGSSILRMVFPNPDGTLLPGMFVRAAVKEGVNEHAILIPQQAVSRDPRGNPLALIVNAEGKAEPRMLTLDRAIGDRWLVVAGLSEGDRVIMEGLQKARPGTAVTAEPFGQTAPAASGRPASTSK